FFFFFFFQAEDGIRDLIVTGVQTCALPISVFALTEATGPEVNRRAQGENRALRAEGQDLLPSHARRIWHVQTGSARRTAPRCRGHRSQLAHGYRAARDGEGGAGTSVSLLTPYRPRCWR